MDKDVHKRIKELREKNEWTQSELSEKSGITLLAISQFESGKRIPPFPILRVLARVFNVTIETLQRKDFK